ncbi:hypothetical protein K3G39_20465, partial [Pontibacter sp. HSC-14F20]|uniref:hypothetical protein n=1 Tax=Pontibacter sp. HSC-14F20 TaxID=2864136 RepID=UPI001C736C57
LADRLLEPPEMAFSSAVGKGLRKAAWRLFSKEEVDVSCGHYPQTAQRCQDCQGVLVSQDRDSDFYESLSEPRPANVDLLLRAHHLQRYVFFGGHANAARGGQFHQFRSGACLPAQGKAQEGADGSAGGELGAGGLPAAGRQKRPAGGPVAGKGHRGGASSRARACSLVSAHHHPGGR